RDALEALRLLGGRTCDRAARAGNDSLTVVRSWPPVMSEPSSEPNWHTAAASLPIAAGVGHGRSGTGLPSAAFLSQLIAARARRRASMDDAVGSYGATGAKTARRLPAGYRRTLVV